jgi:hypothetical protein
MFNSTNVDEVSVQATHLEASKGNHVVEDVLVEPHEFEEKLKEKGKSKKTATMKKDEKKNPICSHCEKKRHDEKHCWKLYPKLKTKWAQPRKGKENTTTIVQDLGSDSENETKVRAMGIKYKSCVASFNSCTSSAKSNVNLDGRQRNDYHTIVLG